MIELNDKNKNMDIRSRQITIINESAWHLNEIIKIRLKKKKKEEERRGPVWVRGRGGRRDEDSGCIALDDDELPIFLHKWH